MAAPFDLARNGAVVDQFAANAFQAADSLERLTTDEHRPSGRAGPRIAAIIAVIVHQHDPQRAARILLRPERTQRLADSGLLITSRNNGDNGRPAFRRWRNNVALDAPESGVAEREVEPNGQCQNREREK